MFFDSPIQRLISFIQSHNGIGKKDDLKELVKNEFNLTLDRKVYYCNAFAIRFSSAKTRNFSNTVLGLSALQKYDDRPFIVCVVLPNENYMLLANTFCLKKISHSSKELRVDNIKGSFNGGDIMRNVSGIENKPENFKDLFLFHEATSFEENLERLVEATNQIVGTKQKVELSDENIKNILNAPHRAINFVNSQFYSILESDLANRIKKVQNSIAIAAFIDNVNIRGRIIEFLITSESEDKTRLMLIDALENEKTLPKFVTPDKLGDYTRDFESFFTETDIKTKVLFLDANPKAYNIDKLLEFLSGDNSVYMLCFVGVSKNKEISMALVSMFQYELLKNTRCMQHWAGRGTRGVTQFYGAVIKDILTSYKTNIDINYSIDRLKEMIKL
ncbi:MAG: hypothetical protein IKB70_12195 [Bacilli bacterium]|nr:hypothetical protein [Bacilli bacterium]